LASLGVVSVLYSAYKLNAARVESSGPERLDDPGLPVRTPSGAGRSKPTGAAGQIVFEDGELFESAWTLSDGTKIRAIAETSIDGKTLHLQDIAIYSDVGDIPNAVGSSAFKRTLDSLVHQARAQGFEKFTVSWQRAMNSTSANPGQVFSYTYDLTK
ncbi:hypothetical protein LJC34_02605, partial [Oscillospiraceae bacterium OttesenSCG-928-G22]|nr:hypothetical protein [Oscillospiraceae bacterium OttesenSCG-928-G22]